MVVRLLLLNQTDEDRREEHEDEGLKEGDEEFQEGDQDGSDAADDGNTCDDSGGAAFVHERRPEQEQGGEEDSGVLKFVVRRHRRGAADADDEGPRARTSEDAREEEVESQGELSFVDRPRRTSAPGGIWPA